MLERPWRYPSSEEIKQALTDLGKRYFIGSQIIGIGSSIFGEEVMPGKGGISFNYEVEKPECRQGELILRIREEDLRSLVYQPKEGEGFIIPFSEAGSDDEIIEPFTKVIRGQMIAGINFKCLDEETSRFSLWLSDGSRIHLDTSREPIGRVMIKERGIYQGLGLSLSKD